MAKPWACTCCGLLNSSFNSQCQACCTYCTVTESAYVCMKCQQVYSDQICRWTKCNHTYCLQCTSNLINQSLSLQNEMPRCIHSKCNQSLDIENGDLFKDLLLKKYQITQNIKDFDRMHHLIYGFIRRIKQNIPNDLILSVCDYYNLVYCAKINCYQCKTLGYELFDCKKCKGLGYTEDCKQCDQTGIYKYNIQCNKCDGTGDYIFQAQCNKCNGSGVYSADCRRCSGSGQYERNGYIQGECRGCDGSGNYRSNCNKCNGSGIFRKRHDCRNCNGYALIAKQIKCSQCRGYGYYKMQCGNCTKTGKVRWDCYKCHGYKELLVLHFNKLCNKQSYCHKCNNYFPNDMVIYWSHCNHSFCYNCSASTIKNEIDQQRVPTCLEPICSEKLDVDHLKLINIPNIEYYNKLQHLTTFSCVRCHREFKQCEKEQFFWSVCNHIYCKKCVSNMINVSLSSSNKVPICKVKNCNQLLRNEEADMMNHLLLNKYQNYKMRFYIGQKVMVRDGSNKWCQAEVKYYKKKGESVPYNHSFYPATTKNPKHNIEAIHIRYASLESRYVRSWPMDEWSIINGFETICDCNGGICYLTKHKIKCATKLYGGSRKTNLLHSFCITTNCYTCNSTGFALIECGNCQGFGYKESCIPLPNLNDTIYKCRGSGFNRMQCGYCNGSGKISKDCYKCDAFGQVKILNLADLCKNQQVCTKCNQYVPNHMACYWLKCDHCCCNDCISEYVIKDIVEQKRIPHCFSGFCDEELTIQNLQLIPMESGLKMQLMKQLELLIYRKNRFECKYCNEWHLNKTKFLWSNCSHQYGIKCVKKYIDESLLKEEALINVFKTQLIPSCLDQNCHQKLKLSDAVLHIGINKYQQKKWIVLLEKEKKTKEGCYVM